MQMGLQTCKQKQTMIPAIPSAAQVSSTT